MSRTVTDADEIYVLLKQDPKLADHVVLIEEGHDKKVYLENKGGERRQITGLDVVEDDPTKIDITTDPLKKRMSGKTMIGGHDFDVPYMSEVVPGLWQGGCENGLILPTHINYLVSLYPWERYTINHKTRGELYVRMYDDPEQSIDQVETIASQVNLWRKIGNGNVLVHCQAGLNRSSLIVARALMLDGMSAADAIDLVRKQRSPACLSNHGFEKYLRGLDVANS